jgi:hypothetical protein
MTRSLRVLTAVALLVAAAVVPARCQTAIGVAAAFNPEMTGTPPSGVAKSLAVGQLIEFNERIATTATGQTQIIFRDESRLSVGPESNVVIDQFVYDPAAGTGKLAMSAAKGLFRFVGGQVSKFGEVALDTPAGAIGIRGGIFIAQISPDGELTVVFVYGKELTVTGRNGARTIVRRPGFAVTIDRAGGGPSAPFAAPRNLLGGFVGQFDGLPGGGGGLPPVTEARLTQTPGFAQLAGTIAGTIDPTRPGQNLPPHGGPLATHPPFGPLGGSGAFDVGNVTWQGDTQLLQITQTICQQRQRC